MLSKSNAANFSLGEAYQIASGSGSGCANTYENKPKADSHVFYEWSIISGGSLVVNWSNLSLWTAGTGTSSSWGGAHLIVWLDDAEISNRECTSGGNYTDTIVIPNGPHTIKIWVSDWKNWNNRVVVEGVSYTATLTPIIYGKTKGGAVPTKVEEIGAQTVLNIFWIFDGEFFVWIETENATTWSITPWNFVGYLQIWDYKIPYYK